MLISTPPFLPKISNNHFSNWSTKLQKRNTPPWVFFTFFKLCEWYQTAQRIKYKKCVVQIFRQMSDFPWQLWPLFHGNWNLHYIIFNKKICFNFKWNQCSSDVLCICRCLRACILESSLSARPVDQSTKETGYEVLFEKLLYKVTNWGINLEIHILQRQFGTH